MMARLWFFNRCKKVFPNFCINMFDELIWLPLGWLFTLTSEAVFRERGRDTNVVSDEARNKIHTIRFALTTTANN